MAVPMVSSAKGVTFGAFQRRIASFRVAGVALCDISTSFMTCQASFCVAGTILLPHVQSLRCIFRDRSSTLETSDVILRGRPTTFDVSCCVYFANRIVRAAQRGDTHHSTLYTLHSTFYTQHFTLYTLQSQFNTSHSTLYTPHFQLYTRHSTLSTLHSTPFTLHFTLHTPLTLYTPPSTLYTPPSTLYTPHFTLHTPNFTLCTPHFIPYTPHFTQYNQPSTL